jgi:Holliday junction resolvase
MAHRKIHRIDETHIAIVDALRGAGFSCVSTANTGGFMGDLVVAADGLNLILEVKPAGWRGPRNEREKEQCERRWEWRNAGGQVEVVRTPFEALQFIKFGLGAGLE